MAVTAARRRSYGDKDNFGRSNRGFQISRKYQSALPHISRNKLRQAGLVDWYFASIEHRDLVSILIQAGDVMPEIGEASPRYQTYVACSDHNNSH
jgi:hypothetical protein